MKKIFVIVLAIRLLLSFLPSMQIDMGAWMAWAGRMAAVGPWDFYSKEIFTANPPGYLYVFWLIGELGKAGSQWWFKLPANLFDLGTGLLIYQILVERKLGRLGILGFLGYTLNPAVVFNASVFGQFDGVGAFFSLLAVYFLLEKQNWFWMGVSFATAWAVKPQAIAVAPALGFISLFLLKSPKLLKILKGAFGFFGATLLLYWPFFPKNPLSGVLYVFQTMNGVYTCTTCFSFNFWGFLGNWQNDQTLFAGLPLMWWGIGITLVILSAIWGRFIWKNCHSRAGGNPVFSRKTWIPDQVGDDGGLGRIYLAISLSIMAFNMFVTRMHERYVLPFFAFFLIAALLSKSKKLIIFYLFFSLFNLLNVYYPYANYNPQYGLTPGLVIWMGEHFRFLSMIGLGSFLVLMWWYLFPARIAENSGGILNMAAGPAARLVPSDVLADAAGARRDALRSRHPLVISQNLSWTKKEIWIITLLLIVSFLIRAIRLDTPKTYYFDEVYHAFTAEAYARNDPRGYEWWNESPKGFAYEWLHPPLAKLIQAGSIKILGDQPFAWRFPGTIFAALTVGLLYLFGRSLFNSRLAGFSAAFLYAFDGLSFTQSRITMNDIYLTFFTTLIFFLFWRWRQKPTNKRLFWTGIALGLSAATKWTGFYAIPILGGFYLLRERNLGKMFLIFLLLPVSIYVLSYGQFWLQGHTLAQFKELHWQIWYYQTHLTATHPYQSSALSWPLDLRPVWYFVEYGQNTVANIYDLGNPVVFWGGLLAIVFILITILKYLFEEKFSIFNFQFSIKEPIFKFLKLKNSFQIKNFKLKINPLLSRRSYEIFSLLFVLIGYFGFFLPWAFSPRIMFLYHYLPSVPFLCLAFGWGLDKIGGVRRITGKILTFAFLLLTLVVFVYFYTQWSALPVPKWWADQYFWLQSWR